MSKDRKKGNVGQIKMVAGEMVSTQHVPNKYGAADNKQRQSSYLLHQRVSTRSSRIFNL